MLSDEASPQLNGQKRAARVTAAFYEAGTLHLRDLVRLTGLSRRGVYDLLANISADGGIPIFDLGDGKWRLCRKYETPPLPRPRLPETPPTFPLHPNTRALIALHLGKRQAMRTPELAQLAGLALPEVRWLLRRMQESGLAIRERLDEADAWETTEGEEADDYADYDGRRICG